MSPATTRGSGTTGLQADQPPSPESQTIHDYKISPDLKNKYFI